MADAEVVHPLKSTIKDGVVNRPWLFLDKIDEMLTRVIDCEVSVRNPDDYSAFDPANRLHVVGCTCADQEENNGLSTSYFHDETEERVGGTGRGFNLSPKVLLIGHNIKYDLHWLMRTRVVNNGGLHRDEDLKPKDEPYVLSDIPLVWDTQLVEYLLSAQTVRMVSLDNLCRIYGLPLKPDTIKKDYWEKGILTKDQIVYYLST
jgi:hypothetical protein